MWKSIHSEKSFHSWIFPSFLLKNSEAEIRKKQNSNIELNICFLSSLIRVRRHSAIDIELINKWGEK